jgi:hypothetical protein
MRPAVSRQGFPDIDLFFREFSVSGPTDVPLVAFMRFYQCAFGRHIFYLCL